MPIAKVQQASTHSRSANPRWLAVYDREQVSCLVALVHLQLLLLALLDTDNMQLASFIAFALLAYAAQVSAAVIGDVAARAVCTTDESKMTSLYRMYNSDNTDHFYTTNTGEYVQAVSQAGYKYEGTAAAVFSSRQPDTVPFYRLYKSGVKDHFYTTSAVERDAAIKAGYVFEKTEGYVYPSTVACGIPLYRAYRSGAGDHFYTVSASEIEAAVASGHYVREGIAAYVPKE
ncbi:hypothetical protein LshimejAT787_0203030 [Lyophyllum shimeji]|uniref:DUF5648 domain-containing protein n=1 Tax=Lyophyllum shimeji TaxID=47721 RepID=A0A9P3PF23_LYOSH|nr:hypothetical protein LshimejAT787_0203030 [Lyophyllum shimeji]